ncbi:MAG: hypothetical protein QOD02_335 [Mycobacterium sp.]|nr:hypothetical protein [Mycobacterium sp.]
MTSRHGRLARLTVRSVSMVREAFVHDAVVAMQPGASFEALGGAITIALCGSWDHPPPCPLASHYVTNLPVGETVALRVLFATEPANEQHVRSLIGETLAAGQWTGPDGRVATWQLRSASPGTLRADEEDHAAHLIAH